MKLQTASLWQRYIYFLPFFSIWCLFAWIPPIFAEVSTALNGGNTLAKSSSETHSALGKIRSKLEDSFKLGIQPENIIVDSDLIPRAFISDEKEIRSRSPNGSFEKQKRLVFLNADGSIKSIRIITSKFAVIAEDAKFHDDTIATVSEGVVVSKNQSTILHIQESYTGKKSNWEDSTGVIITVYDREGKIIWSKDFGARRKSHFKEIYVSPDGNSFALSYYDMSEGSIPARIEFLNSEGIKVGQYERDDCIAFLETKLQGDTLVIGQLYIRKPESFRSVSIKLDFLGNVIRE